MKFLADENVEKPIVDMLRDKGHDVLFMSEITSGTIDDQLLEQANLEARTLLTNDKDFGELIYLQRKIATGIILMRFVSEKSATKVGFISSFLKSHGHRINGNFIVINEAKIRIRPLI